jgi:DNA-binding response OmpR family regulator
MSPQVCTVRRRRHSDVILAVNLCKQDCRSLKTIFGGFRWKLASVATLAQGLRQAESQSVPVIVCECDFQDGNWKLLLDRVRMLPRPPRLIVASRFADERLWAEVLNLGGHDVLLTPFDADEVHRVVSYAVDSWHLESDNSKIRVVDQTD